MREFLLASLPIVPINLVEVRLTDLRDISCGEAMRAWREDGVYIEIKRILSDKGPIEAQICRPVGVIRPRGME